MIKQFRLTESAWRVFWIVASVAVAVLIFYFSSQIAAESNELSKGFLRKLLTLLLGRSPDTLPRRYNHYIRKAAHFLIYALLGFCLTGVFLHQKRLPAIPTAIAVAALYAMTDEFHQSFVPGRGPQITDVLLDTSGAALGASIMGLLLLLLRKTRKTA